MASLNKVMLIGNLGKDPELKYTPSGQAVVTFSLATTRKWKDKDGNEKEDTQWHNIKAWGRLAEIINQYAKKGRQVFVEGRLEHRQYEQDGQKKYFTEVVIDINGVFQLLGNKRDDSGGGEPTYDEAQTANRGYSPAPKGSVGGDEEDLPF